MYNSNIRHRRKPSSRHRPGAPKTVIPAQAETYSSGFGMAGAKYGRWAHGSAMAEWVPPCAGVTVVIVKADILRLGALDQRFNVIESIGVLHHMDQPMAGWQVLAGLLKPGRVMQTGLYNEIALQPVVRARQMIRQWGLGSGPGDIREARWRLMLDRQNPEVAALLRPLPRRPGRSRFRQPGDIRAGKSRLFWLHVSGLATALRLRLIW